MGIEQLIVTQPILISTSLNPTTTLFQVIHAITPATVISTFPHPPTTLFQTTTAITAIMMVSTCIIPTALLQAIAVITIMMGVSP